MTVSERTVVTGALGQSLAELTAEIARQSGRPVVCRDLSETDYKSPLQADSLPEEFVALNAESDGETAEGFLHDESLHLSGLIGRPTRTMARSVAATIAQNPSIA